jgi:broad specificity phosphatase PhoE
MLAPQAVLASSPLTRAVATALLTFGAHRDHIHPAGKLKPVVVVPTARESDAHWFFGRDSLGTPTSQLELCVQASLNGFAFEEVSPASRAYPALDLALLGGREVWWSEDAESGDVLQARLKALLADMHVLATNAAAAAAAAPSPPAVVVLSTHSLVIRRLFKLMAQEQAAAGEASSALLTQLGESSISNCAAVAVTLELKPDGSARMIGAPRLLFGTNFAAYSPVI